MCRPAFVVLCAACALTVGIAVSIGRTAVSADDPPPVPLSKVPPIERFGQAALDAQSNFVQRMSGVSVRYGDNGAVSEIKGRTGVFVQGGLASFNVGRPSTDLLEKFGPALLAAGTEELRVFRVASRGRAGSSERTVRTVQYIRGREVQLSSVNISLNTETNEVTHFVANFLPDRGLQHEPKLTAAEARANVEAAMRDSVLEEEKKIIFEDAPAHLAYAFEEIGDNGGIGGVLVWVFQASRAGEALEASVNALTGQVVRFKELATGINRISYTANNLAPLYTNFPAGLILTFNEGGTPPDTVATNAYNKAGTAFAVFNQAFARNSWDGSGAPQRLVTHYATSTNSAFYGANGYFVFGDAAANDQDVASHEFTHGIIHSETGIFGGGEPDGAPALNEGYGDWGATVSDVVLNAGVVTPGTWSIGPNARNLQAPITADSFARDWFPTRTFILGAQSPHRNSTIMGHALYLLATGGQHYRAGLPGSGVPVIPVTGISYATARQIFYDAIFDPLLSPTSTFFSMRGATFNQALPIHQTSVQQAWNAVGVGYNCSSAPQSPFPTAWPHYCKGRYDIDWPAVPGATRYDGQITQANLGWAFAATVVDANVTTCYQDLPNAYWMLRVRACNGCGCSAWSHTEYMQYYSPCL